MLIRLCSLTQWKMLTAQSEVAAAACRRVSMGKPVVVAAVPHWMEKAVVQRQGRVRMVELLKCGALVRVAEAREP